MNQADHFDMDRADALRELGYQSLEARIAYQRRNARNSAMAHPDARQPDDPVLGEHDAHEP
jgi:hypothetical protein